ncbi:PIN domain-like protein, partial [Melanomma pulvis-pyrius CBS 109.77]
MGIIGLWDTIREQDRSFPIAQLAEEHHRIHDRPFRIAVDEADWQFNNLSELKCAGIRETSTEAFQGIQKNMFYRICRLLTLNIHLLFVFDGPRPLVKRGKRRGGQVDNKKLELLKEMLSYFRIPYHEAPGEAEAECARLQTLGVVDAVFSQDSDSLMFGCDFLIRDDRVAKEKGNNNRSKANTKKDQKCVRVVRGHEIRETHGFDREGLVLFTMLCGGDYDTTGLPNCGPLMAKRAIQHGLGKSLYRCKTKADCERWREELIRWLPKDFYVPSGYPNMRILKGYSSPTISTDKQLLDLYKLWSKTTQPIQELNLLTLTSRNFNICGKAYMKWVAPILLTRALVAKHSSGRRENAHAIAFIKRRAKKSDEPESNPLEWRLTFSPFGVMRLTEKDFADVHMIYGTKIADQLFDPEHRVECEMPKYWLQKVLPLEILSPPTPEPTKASRKRKQ